MYRSTGPRSPFCTQNSRFGEAGRCGKGYTVEPNLERIRRVFFESFITANECSIIDGVVSEYGAWPFNDLRRLCQKPESPWDKHYDWKFGTEIPDYTIRDYEKEMLRP